MEDPVQRAAISPDGAYLAYTDLSGIHLHRIDTEKPAGSLRPLTTTASGGTAIAWFQDGTRLLVSGPAGPKDRTGIWVLAVADGTLSKLRDDAWGAVPSPDGSWIAFRRASAPEIWLMTGSGGRLRRLFTAPPGYGFRERLAWSPDGTRLALAISNRTGTESDDSKLRSEDRSNDGDLSDPQLEHFCWARDGRILYARREDPPHQRSSNLWEVNVDPRTAHVRGAPAA